jgi:predicted glycoside hydrolase/deacetylase ChbG (UPF0249 family)
MQICKVLDTGIAISHLDSHQHIHVLPSIRSIIFDLADQFRIPAVRLPAERLQRYMFRYIGGFARLGQLLALKEFCSMGRWGRIKSPDDFVGFYFGGNVTYRNLTTIIKSLPACGTCELMCHPGMQEEQSRYAHFRLAGLDVVDKVIKCIIIDSCICVICLENHVSLCL